MSRNATLTGNELNFGVFVPAHLGRGMDQDAHGLEAELMANPQSDGARANNSIEKYPNAEKRI